MTRATCLRHHIDVEPVRDRFLVSETRGLGQSDLAVVLIESTGTMPRLDAFGAGG